MIVCTIITYYLIFGMIFLEICLLDPLGLVCMLQELQRKILGKVSAPEFKDDQIRLEKACMLLVLGWLPFIFSIVFLILISKIIEKTKVIK